MAHGKTRMYDAIDGAGLDEFAVLRGELLPEDAARLAYIVRAALDAAATVPSVGDATARVVAPPPPRRLPSGAAPRKAAPPRTSERAGRVAGWLAVAAWLRAHPRSTRDDIWHGMAGLLRNKQMMHNRLLHLRQRGWLVEDDEARLSLAPHAVLPPGDGLIAYQPRTQGMVDAASQARRRAATDRKRKQHQRHSAAAAPAQEIVTANGQQEALAPS